MAKAKRMSMSDTLAEIASSGPPLVEVVAPPREHVITAPIGRVAEDGFIYRTRRERPHRSLYAAPKVFKAIDELARAQGKKQHDFYVEGLRLVLARYGLNYDELSS